MKAFDIALKDLSQSLRSVFLIGMTIVAPLLITGLLYFAFGGMSSGKADLPKLSVGIVNQDAPLENQPALGQMIVEMFNDPSVTGWLSAKVMTDETSARKSVDAQEIGLAVLIPSNFSQTVFENKGVTQLILLQDPTLSIGPVVVRNMIGSLLDGIHGAQVTVSLVTARSHAHGITLDANGSSAAVQAFQSWFTDFQRTLYHTPQAALVLQSPTASDSTQANPIGKLLAILMAGQIIFFSFFTGAYAMLSILHEDEDGTLARLFTTPTHRTVILAGKFLAVVLTVTLQSLVLLLIGGILFHIDWGRPADVALVVVGQVISASGLGVLLISLVKNTRQAGPVLGGALTALGMAGGLFSTTVKMPAGFDLVTRFTPQGWVIQAWKLSLAGSPLADLLLPVGILVLLGAIAFFVGSKIFARRFA